MKPSEAIKFSRPLWQHQANTLDRFAYVNEAALLHEMGTGKTTSAIGWLRAKYNINKRVVPTLIVSPVATLYNWVEEFERNSPKGVFDSVVVLVGTEKQKLALIREDSGNQIFITNPETLGTASVVKALRERGFMAAVVDEVHRFKNYKSKRLAALLSITDSTIYRMVLTGTPILNSYLDIWALWRVLDLGDTFGLNFFVFREKYFVDANAGWKSNAKYFPNYVPKPGIDSEISAMIDRKASRIKKSECLSLPPLVEITEAVELSTEQRRVYDQMENELIAEIKSGVCVATNALVRVLRMLQILSGYIQVETDANVSYAHHLRDNPRLARLKELLEELTPNHKVIVWCVFQENYKAIKEVCEDLQLGWVDLTGQTKDRQENIVKFQTDPNCRVMISNPQAGGVGVNLTAASYSIYFSRSYSLGDRLQSEARDYRGGSEIHAKITHIDLVARGTLEVDVLNALQRKENFSDNILDRLQAR